MKSQKVSKNEGGKSAEVTIDGGKVMKAIAETLVLVWMGYPVGVRAVCGHRAT